MEIMTVPEIAEYLRVSISTVYRLAAQRRIPAFKVGGSWKFRKDIIDDWRMQPANSAGLYDRK